MGMLTFDNPLAENMETQEEETKESKFTVIQVPNYIRWNKENWFKLLGAGYFCLLFAATIIATIALIRVNGVRINHHYIKEIEDLSQKLTALQQEFKSLPSVKVKFQSDTTDITKQSIDSTQINTFDSSLQNVLQDFRQQQQQLQQNSSRDVSNQNAAIEALETRTTDLIGNLTTKIAGFVENEAVQQSVALNKTIGWLKDDLTGLIEMFNKSINDVSDDIGTLRKELVEARNTTWYMAYNGYKYKFVKTRQSWEASRRICQNMGGDLATYGMRSLEIRKRIARQFPIQNIRTWIGLHDLNLEGAYQWIDGVNATKANTFWKPGEPSRNGAEKDCGQILPEHRQYTTDDEECSARRVALCEKKIV